MASVDPYLEEAKRRKLDVASNAKEDPYLAEAKRRKLDLEENTNPLQSFSQELSESIGKQSRVLPSLLEKPFGLDKPMEELPFAGRVSKGLIEQGVGAFQGMPYGIAQGIAQLPSDIAQIARAPLKSAKEIGKQAWGMVAKPFYPTEYTTEKLMADPVGKLVEMTQPLTMIAGLTEAIPAKRSINGEGLVRLPIKERGLEAQKLFAEHGIEAPLTPGEATTANLPQEIEKFLRKTYGGSQGMEKIGYGQYEAGKQVADLIQKKAGGIPTEEMAENVSNAYKKFNELENGVEFNPMALKKGILDQLSIAKKRARSSPIALQYLEDLNDEFKIKKPGEEIWYHGGPSGINEFNAGMVTKSKNLAGSYAAAHPEGNVYEFRTSDIIPGSEKNLPSVFWGNKGDIGYIKPGAKPIIEKQMTVTELNELRKEVGQMIGKAQDANEGNSVKVLSDFKKYIDADFHNIEHGRYSDLNPESAAAIKEANSLYKRHEQMKFTQKLLRGARVDDYDLLGGSVTSPQGNRFYKRLFKTSKKERIRNLGEEGNDLAEALAFYMPNASHALKAVGGKGFQNIEIGNLKIQPTIAGMVTAPLKMTMATLISKIYNNPEIQKLIINSYRNDVGSSTKVLDSLYRQTLMSLTQSNKNQKQPQ